MKSRTILILVISLNLIHLGRSIILESAGIGMVMAIGYAVRCKLFECCDNDYIPRETFKLKDDLDKKLFGQQLARDIVFSAIHSHVYHANPRKPLVLSFHGTPGTGKNYVVSMIANALYKNGEKSAFYHFFNGRSDFPDEKEVDLYKSFLKEKVRQSLQSCDRSLFVFDEVDKMPAGVLDILVPFLDYTSWNGREKSKSIFIFLSNTGSEQIVNRMLQLRQQAKERDEVTLQDFESLIAIGAFNEDGGLYKSGTIESKLIDHHIPFLPMEEKQVIQCIIDSFHHWGVKNPSKEQIQEALKHVTYGPPPSNLYSTGGCKRLDYKVSNILHKKKIKL